MYTQTTSQKFALGRIVSTRTALDVFNSLEICFMLARHISGDWGDCCKEDAKANDDALQPDTSGRILSVYKFEDKRTCWIITEWDRSATTILLPEDY